MSDLIRRSQEAKRLASDASLPRAQRLEQALRAFSGLELTALPEETRAQFEADLVGVNRVLAKYSLAQGEGYERIRDEDLQQMLDLVGTTTVRAVAAELDRIVTSLDEYSGKLPVETICEAREHRDLMIPMLIQVLRDAAAAARAGDVPEGNAHFFALFLLTEFRAQEALPAILEAVSLPDDLPFELFDDAITSSLARVLAALAGDQTEVLETLIRNPDINRYVRWEAAHSYLLLVRDGSMTREEVVERLRLHLRQAIQHEDVDMTGPLILELHCLNPKEALADIEEAYDSGLVESFLIDFASVTKGIAEGDAHLRQSLDRCDPTGIGDTIEELKSWAACDEESDEEELDSDLLPGFELDLRPELTPELKEQFASDLSPERRSELISELTRQPLPDVSALPDMDLASERPLHGRVGRNDPCPCGSGRKFKRCCGSRK